MSGRPAQWVMAILASLCLVACSPRGQLTTLPPGTALPEGASVQEIFVAASRAPVSDGQVFGASRSRTASYARFSMSVPPSHVQGEIEWPTGAPDPAKDFVVQSAVRFDGAPRFEQALSGALAAKPAANRRAVVFIHGYNTNFAEALYRFTQAHHDFQNTDVPVLFTWASAASTVGYLYDRDSVLVARDSLVALLETLEAAGAREIMLVSHSMGTFLLMEALRQIAVSGDTAMMDHLGEVILMSPDIALDVFQGQVDAIGDLPQPFVIFTSQADRALRVSGSLAQGGDRLGGLDSLDRLKEMDITVIDVTALAEFGSLNHFSGATSPEVIELVRRLGAFGQSLDGDIAQSEGLTVVEALGRATEITLQPLRGP